jgi:hypothetical protein
MPISGSTGWRTTHCIAILIAAGLLACTPVLLYGAPDLSWDGAAHAVWARQFASQFWHGDWYPRWFTNINAGYGGSSGFFYPPITNYASSLFWPVVAARDNAGWLASGYSSALAFILSGISAYFWLRSLAGSGAALLGAIAYLVAPYHLAVDLYIRGASAELWVFVWLPLVLLSADGILRHARWAIPGAAASYSLAILSHPSTAVCFAPLAVAYVFFLGEPPRRLRTTLGFTGALLIGVGLDALYLLPALLDQHKASVSLYTSGATDYHNHWILPSRGEIGEVIHFVRNGFSGGLNSLPVGVTGYTLILVVTISTMVALGLVFLLSRKHRADSRAERIINFYAVTAVIVFFLMIKPSAFIWQASGFLKFLQFPSRLNVLLAICLAALMALAAHYLWQPLSPSISLSLSAIALGWLAINAWAPTHVYSAWRPNPAKSNWHWIQAQMEPSDMMPKVASNHIPAAAPDFDQFLAEHPPKSAQLQAPGTEESAGTAQVTSCEPRRVLLNVDGSKASRLTFNYFYYEGWKAHVDSASDTLSVAPSPEGFMQVDVPPGRYELVLELPQDKAERAGSLLSLLSLGILVGLTLRAWPRSRGKLDTSDVTRAP